MSTISAFDAKTRFGELLDRVARGEEIVISRHEKPVARMIPEGRPGLNDIREVVKEIRAVRTAIGKRKGFKPLSDKEIKTAMNAGRP